MPHDGPIHVIGKANSIDATLDKHLEHSLSPEKNHFLTTERRSQISRVTSIEIRMGDNLTVLTPAGGVCDIKIIFDHPAGEAPAAGS